MEITSSQAYSILGVVGGERGAIISKSGTLTLMFEMGCPEAYSLYSEDYESIHNEIYKALKNMPENSFLHKQDIYLKKEFTPQLKETSFINKAENRHFAGREYIEHRCILAFSLAYIEDLEPSYFANPAAFNMKLSKKSKDRIDVFIDSVEGAVSIIKNIRGFSIKQLSEEESKQYIFDYCNGFSYDSSVCDIHFAENLAIGNKIATVFTISDEKYLPDSIASYVNDDTLPTSNSSLFMSELEPLGIHLLCNHIYNQVIWFEGDEKLKSELDTRVKVHGQHQAFFKEIKFEYDKLRELQDEIIFGSKMMCRASFNLILFDQDERNLRLAENKVKEILRKGDYKFYMPSFDGLKNIWIGSIVGRENKLSRDYYFLTDLNIPLCLMTKTTSFKSDEEGIFFNDRIFQTPIRKDIWDASRKRIPARNAIVVASTGAGKSAATLNIIQQMLENGTKCIICEFGKSFEQLAQLYPDISMHIDYDGQSPLGINPFDLNGQQLDIDKVKTLVEIVLKFWRKSDVRENTDQRVSLTKIIEDYYIHIEDSHSFQSFYVYVRDNIKDILERQQIHDKFFNYDSFIHICSEFMPGGIYENVCKKGDNERNILHNDLIVFELTKIKKDPFLTSLIMTILFDTIESKILKDKSTRGMLIFDEYAETQAMKDESGSGGVHASVAFCYQKLRKDNGAIMTIIQSPSQLPDNEYTKNIISNTQILYVLPTTEVVYSQVIDTFQIKKNSFVNLMKSIKNNFSGKKPYSEIYIKMLDIYNIVVRLEFSKEKFFAFQTDSEDWQAIHEDYQTTKNMEKSIMKYIELKERN